MKRFSINNIVTTDDGYTGRIVSMNKPNKFIIQLGDRTKKKVSPASMRLASQAEKTQFLIDEEQS